MLAIAVILAYRWLAPLTAYHPPAPNSDRLNVATGAARGQNLLVVTLDTLRADRLGCYGYGAAQTPHIDALAARGALFLEAAATAPLTLPSHATIFTGLYPPRHAVRNNGEYTLADEHVTLAERMKVAGYDTAAFIAAYVVVARYGLSQGFDTYDDDLLGGAGSGRSNEVVDRPANEVVDSFLKWYVARAPSGNRPFFAWIHLYDPHFPYAPPSPFKENFAGREYDGEIAFTDQQLGRVVEALQSRGELDRTLILVVSDHGESLGEHGEATHSHLIYDCTMKVPLILSHPKLFPAAQIVGGPAVSTADIMPTVLSLLGLPPEQNLDGVNLAAGPPPADRAVYMETLAPKLMNGWSPLYGMRACGEKFIQAPTQEYYDLAADPGELTNLIQERKAEARRMSALLGDYQTKWGVEEAPPLHMDSEQLARLRALGYVGDSKATFTGADPKVMIRVWDKYNAAKGLMQRGDAEQALELVHQALDMSEDDPYGYRMLAQAYMKLNRGKDARRSAERLVELTPNSTDARAVLASACLAAGDRACFDRQIAIGLELDPREPTLHLAMGDGAAMEGRYEAAIRHFRRVIELDRAKYGDLATKKIARAEEMLARNRPVP